MEGFKINIEFDTTLEDQTLEGTLISTMELNKIGRSGKTLIYQMNVMDEYSKVYMWFKDDAEENYFVVLDR